MGLYHVGQAGLELLTSGDLPASASQNAGITDVSHCTRLVLHFHSVALLASSLSSFGDKNIQSIGMNWKFVWHADLVCFVFCFLLMLGK